MQFIPTKTSRRPAITVLSILLLLSMACSFTGTAQPTAIPSLPPPALTVTPSDTAVPQTGGGKVLPNEILPPAIVESDPPAGSRIPPAGSVTFYFNQAMDRPSVEAALGGEPTPSGKFEWLDDSALRFTPAQAYPASVPVSFTFPFSY